MKRLARDFSLRKGQISNAVEFFNFVKSEKTVSGENYKTIPLLVTPEEISATDVEFKDRWSLARRLDGTLSFHDFRCDESNERYIFVRKVSTCEEYQRMCIYKGK